MAGTGDEALSASEGVGEGAADVYAEVAARVSLLTFEGTSLRVRRCSGRSRCA